MVFMLIYFIKVRMVLRKFFILKLYYNNTTTRLYSRMICKKEARPLFSVKPNYCKMAHTFSLIFGSLLTGCQNDNGQWLFFSGGTLFVCFPRKKRLLF